MGESTDDSPTDRVYGRRDLIGGTTLLHEERTTPPVLSVRTFLPVGSALDPAGAKGLANLTARTLVSHTRERTMTEMNRYQSRYGLKVSASVQPDYTVFSFRSLEEHTDRLLSLIREVFTKPAFDSDTVEHLRDQQTAGIRQRRDDTFRHAFDCALSAFYGTHPYAHPPLGTIEDVKTLDTGQVRAFFEDFYATRDLVVSSVGPVDTRTIEETVGAINLPAGSRSLESIDGDVRAGGRSTITRPVDQPTHVVLYPTQSIEEPEYVPLKVTEALLGGGMGSLLFRRVREERSLGYQVGASYPSRKLSGTMRFYLGGGSPEGSAFLSVLEDVLETLAREGPGEDDLHKAREYRKGRFRLDHESPGKIAWYRGFYELMGRGAGFDDRYPSAVEDVTADDVRDAVEDLREGPKLHFTVLPGNERDEASSESESR